MNTVEETQLDEAPTGECYDCGWKGFASEIKPPDEFGFIYCPKCRALSIWDTNKNK